MKVAFLLLHGFTTAIVFGFMLTSCCAKKECISAFNQKEIKLVGFTKQESDSILVSSYVQGGNFTNLIDSASTSAGSHSGNDDGDLIIFVPIAFNAKSDYRIEFKKTGLIYKISEINTTQEKCNSCFLKEDNYTELSSYKLNGQLKINAPFEIAK